MGTESPEPKGCLRKLSDEDKWWEVRIMRGAKEKGEGCDGPSFP
jgi:hypothetical protein